MMNKDIASIRKDYQMASLEEANTAEHPMTQFEHWWEDAIASNIDEVNAFVLSTINLDGVPSARVLLLKGFTPEGFVFFTNYNSDKAKDIKENSYVALEFLWLDLERQIKIIGSAEKVSTAESIKYFLS